MFNFLKKIYYDQPAEEKPKDCANIVEIREYLKQYPRVNWHNIIIHHSLTKDGEVKDWEAIKKYHIETMKWKTIGYALGLELIGKQYQYRIGRPLNMVGAHTKEQHQNQLAIGVCVIGNFDVTEPSSQQYFLTAHLCYELMQTYHIKIENIYGHRDFATYKSCPGKNFKIPVLTDTIVKEFPDAVCL